METSHGRPRRSAPREAGAGYERRRRRPDRSGHLAGARRARPHPRGGLADASPCVVEMACRRTSPRRWRCAPAARRPGSRSTSSAARSSASARLRRRPRVDGRVGVERGEVLERPCPGACHGVADRSCVGADASTPRGSRPPAAGRPRHDSACTRGRGAVADARGRRARAVARRARGRRVRGTRRPIPTRRR